MIVNSPLELAFIVNGYKVTARTINQNLAPSRSVRNLLKMPVWTLKQMPAHYSNNDSCSEHGRRNRQFGHRRIISPRRVNETSTSSDELTSLRNRSILRPLSTASIERAHDLIACHFGNIPQDTKTPHKTLQSSTRNATCRTPNTYCPETDTRTPHTETPKTAQQTEEPATESTTKITNDSRLPKIAPPPKTEGVLTNNPHPINRRHPGAKRRLGE